MIVIWAKLKRIAWLKWPPRKAEEREETMSTTTTITAATTVATVNGEKPKSTLQPEGSRLLLLISSMSAQLEVKARQVRIQAILDGLFLPEDQVEMIDGCDPKVRQRRSELFSLSGKTGQYPQLFLSTPDTTNYVGDSQEIFAMHDANLLTSFVGLVVLETKAAIVKLRTSPKPSTTWVRQPSSRRLIYAEKRISEVVMTEYKGSESHERAAQLIQRTVRLWLFPITRLRAIVQSLQNDAQRIVAKINRNTQKTKSNIRKQYDKDCKKVDKLVNDIKRRHKKEKLLKHDIRVETKLRDDRRKMQEKVEREKQRRKKYTEKQKQYQWRVAREEKHLKTWDKDIEAVRKENEMLLTCITNISELLAMGGVNWMDLTKSQNQDENLDKSNIQKEEKPKKSKADPPPSTNQVETMMRLQSARQSMVSMVRQESQRFANSSDNKKTNRGDETEAAPPVYFARLNSRAKLVMFEEVWGLSNVE